MRIPGGYEGSSNASVSPGFVPVLMRQRKDPQYFYDRKLTDRVDAVGRTS